MAYELLISRQTEKAFRKFPAHIRESLIAETMKLAEQPYLGEPLKGRFRLLRSLHINIQRVQYRVVYEVIEAKKHIHVHAVGNRENFYKKLERLKLKVSQAAG